MRCPCPSGEDYEACCRPLHRGRGSGRVTAQTAEQLMRSRYSAFALHDETYLLATWDASTRPAEGLDLDPEFTWRGLEILETTDGGPEDATGTVRFVARFWDPHRRERGELAEHSTFARQADGQWVYVRALD